MDKVYIIIRYYNDAEGCGHRRVEEYNYFLTKEAAQTRVEEIVKSYKDDFEEPPILRVVDLALAGE